MWAKEASAKIEELTGIKKGETQVRKFLKSLGFHRRKIGYVPGKADFEVQKEYLEEKLEPRLEQAKNGTRAVFFVDAAHFVIKPFWGWIWCLSRIFIKSPSGRKRRNVLGALNAITKEIITVENDSYITATQVIDLLNKISQLPLTIPKVILLAKYFFIFERLILSSIALQNYTLFSDLQCNIKPLSMCFVIFRQQYQK